MLGLGNSLVRGGVLGFSNTYSLELDGTDDYVTVTDDSSLDITSTLTISAWVKVNSFDTAQDGIVNKCDTGGIGYGMYLTQGADSSVGVANFYSERYNQSAATSGNLNIDTWYHLAGTFSDSADENKIYVDGSLVATATEGSPMSANNEPLEIGRIFKNPGYNLNGFIDEVSIFNEVVSVSSLRDGTKPADLTGLSGLVGWWRMGDGTEGASGNTIYDMSTNSNDGTFTDPNASGIQYSTTVPT